MKGLKQLKKKKNSWGWVAQWYSVRPWFNPKDGSREIALHREMSGCCTEGMLKARC
jgi:hypothetical protein